MIQVLERFAKIMNHVSAHDEAPCRLRDLAAMLGVSPSACANIVSSMVKLGYLESAEQGGYRLGPTPSLLVRSGAYKQYIVQTAAPFLEELVRRINENCLIVTHSDGKRVVLLSRKSSRELQLNEPLMTENLMHTATGCVMLAHMSGEELERYESVQPFAGSIFPAVTSWSGFRAKLAGIRRDGIAFDNRGVGWDGRRALAVPVYRDGELECVLGCWYPTVRANPKHRACIALNCRKTAGRISAALDAL